MKRRVVLCLTGSLLVACALIVAGCSSKCKEHDFTGTETVIKEATCTEAGSKLVQCRNCNETTTVTIPAAHKFGEYSYDYDTKSYLRSCSVCGDTESANAGSEQLPLLARDEAELADVILAAMPQSYIELANDVTINSDGFTAVLRLPDGGTLDLGGHTVTVKNNGGFLVEGTDVTLQNGKVVTDFADPASGYAVFIGDEGENNRVTLRNLETVGGINVYNCEATLYDCNVNASNHKYYALWADEHSTITVESGVYQGGETACVHSTAQSDPEGSGYVVLNGGTFHGNIFATFCTRVNGGEINGDVVLTVYKKVNAKLIVNKDYGAELNITVGEDGYKCVEGFDENGNHIYETAPIE